MKAGRAWLVPLFLLAAVAPIWCYLGGPPLTPRSDGRYAAVSRDVADHDHWLAPRLGDELHLTKPPLTYWAEAACIKALGATDLAVRMPSAIAGTLLVLGVLAVGWHVGGRRVALLAAGVLAIMPMHIVISRLTLTDGLLQLWWFGTLVGAWMAVRQPLKRRWPALLWTAVALGWLTKGPIALIPLLIVVAWLGLAGRWRRIRSLRPATGFALSLVPVATWFAAVVTQVPDAWAKISAELSTQAGGGAHASESPGMYLLEVVSYYPVLMLATMFPATAMLNVPPINYSFKAAWRALREGRCVCLWALAVVLPLIIFSLSPSKLPSYIAPAAAPLAILTGLMLDRWLDGRHDAPVPGYRRPEVRGAVFAVMVVCVPVAFAAAVVAGLGWLVALPLVAPLAAAGYMAAAWRTPAARTGALTRVWIALVISCVWGTVAATTLFEPVHPRRLLQRVHTQIGRDALRVVTFDYTDHALSFYDGRFVPRHDSPDALLDLASRHPRTLAVFADAGDWRDAVDRQPALAARFAVLFEIPPTPAN
ncbi:MAG: phospholipid carrier-dependent glycosyltransferase, partial [Alphaproteobacteria bacterium]|nr:phospholipid carrier-dependent glycosyltransferase [Alphaproteobacteria bacterium]